ncbi:hypothetical protein F183_A04310 [Bryobacterales bacterium F-183]|nr:hypothetical protein F183_A04310 [Bryobacterales bacterium F-183]
MTFDGGLTFVGPLGVKVRVAAVPDDWFSTRALPPLKPVPGPFVLKMTSARPIDIPTVAKPINRPSADREKKCVFLMYISFRAMLQTLEEDSLPIAG